MGTSQTPDRHELAKLLQAGYRYALAMTRSKSRAEDLAQEACISILKAKGGWNKRYLFLAIRSRVVDESRKAHLELVESLDQRAEGGELKQGLAHEAEQELLADRDQVRRALNKLPDAMREAVYLSAVEGYSAREIAGLTQRPRSTVLTLMQRGKKQIREFVQAEDRREARR